MENGAQKTQLFGSRFLFCCLMFEWSMDTACASVRGLLDTITFPHFSSKYILSHRQNASRLCHTVTENVPVAWDHNKTMTISYSFTIHLTWILDTPAPPLASNTSSWLLWERKERVFRAAKDHRSSCGWRWALMVSNTTVLSKQQRCSSYRKGGSLTLRPLLLYKESKNDNRIYRYTCICLDRSGKSIHVMSWGDRFRTVLASWFFSCWSWHSFDIFDRN